MTNKEYLTKSLRGLKLSDDDIDIIIAKGALDPNDTADFKMCDRAVYRQMSIVLKGTLRNISEGGYSSQWNTEAVKIYYAALCLENGFRNVLLGRTPVARFL